MNTSPLLAVDGREGDSEILWQDGEHAFRRAWRAGVDGGREPFITVFSTAEEQTPAINKRFAHEYSLKDQLESTWALRPIELLHERGQSFLSIESPAGEPLVRHIGVPMELRTFLKVAISISVSVGRMHGRGLVHKDIKPANVVVDIATGRAWLTGFGIASHLPREHQAPDPPEHIAGTLPYMAPEQTGRMNRSIDSRSDLYSLGMTLYQLVTGSLPFAASDPMGWVHCHIARRPEPPKERLSSVPDAVSAIVVKLLAKTPEERYQTAAGVESDLRRCLAAWEQRQDIDVFQLGASDKPDRLIIPEKLYGRERDVDALLASFDRILRSGKPEIILVSGYSGIGKSSVVNELHRVLVPPQGLFASGKFDQYKRDIPCATLAQAFQTLVRPLLGKEEAELSKWRDDLEQALAPNGALLLDLIPDLKFIVGEQPPVPELAPRDTKVRFHQAIRQFIGVFARQEHPLVLFVDDLQWVDSATLEVIEDLLVHPDVKHLMVIGAYRDNEVGPTHPLAGKLKAIRQGGAVIAEIVLSPLTAEHLTQLVADSLRCELEQAAALAKLIHEKTGGNPFFAVQFISSLAEEGLLSFSQSIGRWQWDLANIRAKGYTDNVIELMVGRLSRLPAAAQTALQQFACIGNTADFATLAIALETSEQAVQSALWEALRLELILPLSGSYKFAHDRIHEAAYSLIPEVMRAESHLRTGRLLAARLPPERREEAIFEIVNQLNRGASLISSQEERDQLAEFNLLAGKRAQASTAYPSALDYFSAGSSLMADDSWERRHELAFGLELGQAQCEFISGAVAEAEERLRRLSTRAQTTLERTTVAGLRVDLYMSIDQTDHAIIVGLEQLRYFGIDWPSRPTEEDAKAEYYRIWTQLGDRKIEDLINLPIMSDPASLATMDLLIRVAVPGFFASSYLFAVAVCKAVNVSLEHGNCDASCIAYELLAMLAGPYFDDYNAGYRFGQLGCELAEQPGLQRFQARTYQTFGFVIPWTKHVREGREPLRRALELAIRVGDITYAGYACGQLDNNLLMSGDPLAEAQKEAEIGLEFAQKAHFGLVVCWISAHLGLIRTLRGLTDEFGSFNSEQFNEGDFERYLSSSSALAQPDCWYWIRKLQASVLAGDHAAGLRAISRAQPLLWTARALLEMAEYHFYAALCHAGSCDKAGPQDRQFHFEALATHRRQLEKWAGICPENFENRAALVAAEMARVYNRELEAERLYERAIQSARANGFVHNEALANELAAGFYRARGFEKIALTYLRDARHCYSKWGAEAKVRQLDRTYPRLGDEISSRDPAFTILAPVEHLDLVTVIRVSQAISGEIVLEKLIDTLMRTAIEHAGAARGVLILPQGGDYFIEAEATIGDDEVTVELRHTSVTADDLPESVFRYVLRTKESILLNNANESQFSSDDYVRRHQARSILCLPLFKQARLLGMLYLENNLTGNAFSANQVSILKLLVSEAATSLENTRLYSDLQEREARIRRLVDSNIIGIFFWNIDGYILDSNEAFLRLIGHQRDDLSGNRLRWTDITPEQWHAVDERRFADIMATGVAQPYEKEFLRKDGTRVPVLIGGAIFDEAGENGVAFVVDLTDRRQAEEAARESDRRYHEIQMELAHANRIATLGQLSASIAHEVAQPLTGILTNVGMCMRVLTNDPSNVLRLREALERTLRDANRASEVVARLRALFARRGKKVEPVDLNDATREVIGLSVSDLAKNGVHLRTELAEDVPIVEGDRVQLQQVVFNLLRNASDAMSTLDGRPRELVIRTVYSASEGVRLVVQDSGPGIRHEDLERVFGAFYSDKAGGLGIGLAICRTIVESHGGKIWATLGAPYGAVFQFVLPAAVQK